MKVATKLDPNIVKNAITSGSNLELNVIKNMEPQPEFESYEFKPIVGPIIGNGKYGYTGVALKKDSTSWVSASLELTFTFAGPEGGYAAELFIGK